MYPASQLKLYLPLAFRMNSFIFSVREVIFANQQMITCHGVTLWFDHQCFPQTYHSGNTSLNSKTACFRQSWYSLWFTPDRKTTQTEQPQKTVPQETVSIDAGFLFLHSHKGEGLFKISELVCDLIRRSLNTKYVNQSLHIEVCKAFSFFVITVSFYCFWVHCSSSKLFNNTIPTLSYAYLLI